MESVNKLLIIIESMILEEGSGSFIERVGRGSFDERTSFRSNIYSINGYSLCMCLFTFVVVIVTTVD